MIPLSIFDFGINRRTLAIILLPGSMLLLAAGCDKEKPANESASGVISAYLVEERGSGDEWYYVPVWTIRSAALDRFLCHPLDLKKANSDGHAADGYFASVVIVKEPDRCDSAVLWQFANSGDLIMQDRVVMRESASGTVEFAFPKEDLGKVPVFVKSSNLSEIIRECVSERMKH
jgi:hypothetical protein